MHSEDGFASLHYVIAAVFALTVALGAFAGTMAMESMTESQMSEVEGQEGIAMDLRLGNSFKINEVRYTDGDGWSGAASTEGVVGIHNISSPGNLNMNGVTIDADGSASAKNGATGAIVIGLPQIPSGIEIGAITPGNRSVSGGNFTAAPTEASLGSFAAGGIDMTGASVVISANTS